MQTLEGRALLSFSGFEAALRPQILSPPNGRSVDVIVAGSYRVGPKDGPAQANFQVVDEYRLVQPRALIRSHAVAGDPGLYRFRARVSLQASVAENDDDGRLYTIAVGARQPNGSVGTTLAVLVPAPGMKVAPPRAARARATAKS